MTVVEDSVIDLTDPRMPRLGSRSPVGPAVTHDGGRRLLSPVDLAAVVAVTVAVALPVVVWGRIFADGGHRIPVVAAAVSGSALALAAVSVRLRWLGSFALLVGGLLIGLAGWYNTAVADLPGDLVSSWKALASNGLLISTSTAFVMPAVVVSAVTAWLASSLILRPTPNIYSVIPVGAATAAALAYAASLGDLPSWYVPVVVLLLTSMLVSTGLRRPAGVDFDAAEDGARHRWSPRQLAIGAAAVVALGAGSLGFSALFGTVDDDAFNLRERLVKPLDIYESATPLAGVKAGLISDPSDPVFDVTLVGLSEGEQVELLPVATLDLYDGSIWTTSASFEPAGARLPVPEQTPAITGREVRLTIELDDAYPFRFYPRVGTVRALDEAGLAWDPRSGTVASVDPDAAGYSATVDLAAPRPEPLPAPGTAGGALDYAAEAPETTDAQFEILADYVNRVAASGRSPQEQLDLIEANLRSADFGYNEDAPAGHSLAALTSYLSPAESDGTQPAARVGFSEQAASLFAVIARQLGIPSRVVVGYLLDDPLTEQADTATVTESQIHAWPEVWIDGRGWVGFEPTNRENVSPDPAPRTPAVSSAGDQTASEDLPDLQEPILLPNQDRSEPRSTLWWLLVVPALPLAYAAVVFVAKAFRRTRRRRLSSPERRIVGAWLETRDRLRDLELPAAQSSSALDLAEHLEVIDLRGAAEPLAQLAPVVDHALYAPIQSTPAQADQAWALSKATVSAVRKSMSPRRRLSAALDPSTFFRS